MYEAAEEGFKKSFSAEAVMSALAEFIVIVLTKSAIATASVWEEQSRQ